MNLKSFDEDYKTLTYEFTIEEAVKRNLPIPKHLAEKLEWERRFKNATPEEQADMFAEMFEKPNLFEDDVIQDLQR